MIMRILQKNSQNLLLLMFQKINEKRKNQNRDKSKVHILYNKDERNFNCDDFFARLNFKKHCDLNRKKHKTKNKQIVEKTLF